ncbi:hypothetical protein VOLCADRAFT_84030 [Volvox carteri f. nagariensis]|uniref:Uncharacterized protein n=1 Tax=Volvox carteri f. nagariensis TaxID=3068 RepID=D8UEU3_VOLCA|nr:uncharacterized protein VOLCADRAFT_84030 [Volvox carteri f. nagariensis]EFJ41744.1 hypothetical protein VOLCADRAFT_84030 [Volvox carteri f. nagariensis]|eukprot:XP_002957246.1 hypothetical protein VOLCADRAFT_84030 [Volvox carteri f. nagariensis]
MQHTGRAPNSALRIGQEPADVCPFRAFRRLASSPRLRDCFSERVPASSARPLPLPPRYAPSHANVGVVERIEGAEELLPLPRNLESPSDDPSLANPLQRMERLSTGWFGVIMEFEGVVVEASDETHRQAWLQVADEFKYKRPLGQLLRRIKGVRDEVVVSRVFGWTHNPSVARQVAQRKGEIYEQLMGGRQPAAMLEARPFLETLKRYSVPVALATPLHEAKVHEALQRHNLQGYFDATVTAEDSGSAEVEFYYAYAASKIQRPPIRCVVVGESNTSVEAAHELGMKCVVVTGNAPVYDFTGADLVVRNLSQLSFMNMKRLFADENLVESRLSGEEGAGREALASVDEDDYADDDDEGFQPMSGAALARW